MANAVKINQFHFYREPQNSPYSIASNFSNANPRFIGWIGANDSGGSRDQWVNSVYSSGWGDPAIPGTLEEFWHYQTLGDVQGDAADANLASPPGTAQTVSVTHSTLAEGQANLLWKIVTNNLTADDGGAISGSNLWPLTDDQPGQGNMLEKYGYANHWKMDLGNSGFRQFVAGRLNGILNNTITAGNASATQFGEALINHLVGIFLDDGNADNNGRVDVGGSPTAIASAVGSGWSYYNDADAWRDACREFVQYIYENVCVPNGLKLMINMQGTDFNAWKYWMDLRRSADASERVFDGCMIEFYCTDSSGNHNNVSDWYLTVQKQQYLEGNGQAAWCVVHGNPAGREAETGGTITNNDHWAFAMATYLAGWGNRSRFRYHSGSYGDAYDFDELHKFIEETIGAPVDPVATWDGTTLTREFDGVTITVTPGNNTDGSATTATNSFKFAYKMLYQENSGDTAEIPADNEGGGTWVENSTTTQPLELTNGAFDSAVTTFSPTVPNTTPRFAIPWNVLKDLGKETNTTGSYYDLEWTIGGLTAGTYPIWFGTYHDGGAGAVGQIDMDLEVDGIPVLSHIDPVADAGATQTFSFYRGLATIADTDVVVKLKKNGTFDARVGFLAVLQELPTPAPVVNVPNDQIVTVNESISLQVTASNPSEIGTLTYSVDSLPTGLSIDSDTGLITGTIYPQEFSDIYEDTTVTVSNGTDSTDVTFRWWIQPGTRIIGINCANSAVTDPYTGYTFEADTSGTPHMYHVVTGTGVDNQATYTYNDTVPPWHQISDLGNRWWFGNATIDQYTIPVADANKKLVVLSFLRKVASNRIFDVIINSSVVDNNLNIYSAGLNVVHTRRYQITPQSDGGGGYEIDITFAKDPDITQISSIEIWDIQNDAPVMSAIGNQSNTVNVAITPLTPSAVDVADTLTWGATNLPTGLSINTSTGEVTGTPTVVNAFNTTITVTDNRTPSKSDSETFTWTISDAGDPSETLIQKFVFKSFHPWNPF